MIQTTNTSLKNVELIIFDFDGVFTDNFVTVDEHGNESVRCSRSDGIGLARLADIGIKLIILSSETNQVVSQRAKKLNIKCLQGVCEKGRAVVELCEQCGVELPNVMFVGNDINDIPALSIVGIPVGVADAHDEIHPYTAFRTRKKGGRGAVREICDLVYNVKMNK